MENIEIISGEIAKKLKEKENQKMPDAFLFMKESVTKQRRIAMIVSRMISEKDVCGSVFFKKKEDGSHDLLVSTNCKSKNEQSAEIILSEIADFVNASFKSSELEVLVSKTFNKEEKEIREKELEDNKKELEKFKSIIVRRAVRRVIKDLFYQTTFVQQCLNIFVKLNIISSSESINFNDSMLKAIHEIFEKKDNLDKGNDVVWKFISNYSKINEKISNKGNGSLLVENGFSNEVIEFIFFFSDLYGVDEIFSTVESQNKDVEHFLNAIRERSWKFPVFCELSNDGENIFVSCNKYKKIKRNSWCLNCKKKDFKNCTDLGTVSTLHTEQKKIEHYGSSREDLKYLIEGIVDPKSCFGISKSCCYPCHLKLTSVCKVLIEEKEKWKRIEDLGCSGSVFGGTRYPNVQFETAIEIQKEVSEKFLIDDCAKDEEKKIEKNFPINECFYSYAEEVLDWAKFGWLEVSSKSFLLTDEQIKREEEEDELHLKENAHLYEDEIENQILTNELKEQKLEDDVEMIVEQVQVVGLGLSVVVDNSRVTYY